MRFTSPHPKDFGDDCLAAIAAHPNICNHLHMPAQSGSSSVLQRMRRGYTRAAYDALVQRAAAALPGVSFSTDIIVGFCGETEHEHAGTLDLLRSMQFPLAFIFAYSRRERTHAARHLNDDVPEATKQRRLQEALAVYCDGVRAQRAKLCGSEQLVMPSTLQRCACCCDARLPAGFAYLLLSTTACFRASLQRMHPHQFNAPEDPASASGPVGSACTEQHIVQLHLNCMQVLVESCTVDGNRAICSGRTDGFHKLHMECQGLPCRHGEASHIATELPQVGDYVAVTVQMDHNGRLHGQPLGFSSITEHVAAKS